MGRVDNSFGYSHRLFGAEVTDTGDNNSPYDAVVTFCTLNALHDPLEMALIVDASCSGMVG